MTRSLGTHGAFNNGPEVKVSSSAFHLWKVLCNIWLIAAHWNRLALVNHFQMYFALFTVNSYRLTSCCQGPVARQTCLTSRCEVTIRQRLTCFLFQWSHCTVNICNGNTPGKMQYGLTGMKLQPSRGGRCFTEDRSALCFWSKHGSVGFLLLSNCDARWSRKCKKS